MAVPRINIKSIDYFKFKKLVIDCIRDDYNQCDKDVKSFCDSVQTLNFRDEEFDDVIDRTRFEEVCSTYRQILGTKRIDPTDMRIKSGWWGDHKNAYSAGKLKPLVLRDTLVEKASMWCTRHGEPVDGIQSAIEGPGLYVLKHREHQCFQYVGRADKIFARFAERLKAAFEGSIQEPLAALLVISMATDWDFYFIPVGQKDDEKVLRILENDLILKHDSIWPHGLNFRLHIDSLLEVSEFRKSCLRHRWPPDDDDYQEDFIDLDVLRKQVENQHSFAVIEEPIKTPIKKAKPRPAKDPKSSPDEELERPSSAMSSSSESRGSSDKSVTSRSGSTPKHKPSSQTPRPTSAGRRTQPASGKSSDKTTHSASLKAPLKPTRPATPKRKQVPPPKPPRSPAEEPPPAEPPAEITNGSPIEPEPEHITSEVPPPDVLIPDEPACSKGMVKSTSGSSISSSDTYTVNRSPPPSTGTPEGSPKKSPAAVKKGAKAKARVDKSRLPVVSSK